MTKVKICGVTTPEALEAAIEEKADFIGFVFFGNSPRNLSPERAAQLIERVPSHIKTVGLFVDADDAGFESVFRYTKLDMIQLHGSENPRRVTEIKSRYQLPVMKVIKVADASDLVMLGETQSVADMILFDAKPPANATLPGGNGHTFDWNILKNLKVPKPWMLSGGLTPDNIKTALEILSPDAVDVSSGVEDRPGVKNPDKIRAFIRAVKQA